jgi:hypothetical protein
MGLFDTLLGRTKPVRANLDALFALPSAAVTLETSIGLVPSGKAGVCWKPPAGRPAEDVQREIAQLLDIPDDGRADPGASPTAGGAAGTDRLTTAEDSFGYRWLLLDDPDVESLVTRIHVINATLTDDGWGPQLLCSVFGLVPGPEADADTRPVFLVYLYKRGTFYPFAPDAQDHRDSEFELRIRSVLGKDLPTEPDLSRWFPLWDMPLR